MPVTCKGKSGIWYNQLNTVNDTLGILRRRGVIPGMSAYDTLYKLRGEIMGKIGLKVAKPVQLIMKLVGLSPGVIKLWMDAESGWMSEARERPGAAPVYKRVSDEVAVAIIKEEVTKELVQELLTPDDYLGE